MESEPIRANERHDAASGSERQHGPEQDPGAHRVSDAQAAGAEEVSGIQERYAIYRLLARLWLQEPDADLLAVLRGPAAELFAAFGGSLEVKPPAPEEGRTEPAARESFGFAAAAGGPVAGASAARGPAVPDVDMWSGPAGQFAGDDAGMQANAVSSQTLSVTPAEWVAEASEDFCRLWIGPSGHLPPYQSVWEQSELSGDAAMSVRSYLEQLDRWSGHVPRISGGEDAQAGPGWLFEPATRQLARCRIAAVDHLGAELLVMSDLLVCEAAGVAEPGTAAGFFRAHLSWPGELLAYARERARTPFYRSVVAMTRQFVLCEAVTLAAAR